ncbi:RNA dependent RNA polymerase-domain-containing protein [Podospora fimiseda]|uniref:RNA-dependent RNA polymerase n=1 Tax=Podospora fimiseda TaxID=252190 RepID=A0AAN7BH85_9PEZI|nr:RNA dependent RNA polymerase-domain-containing protein [Podospora fimiseda]
MEVFMRNIEEDLTEHALEELMRPVLEKLNIIDFHCGKRKKTKNAKTTFLDKADGQRFLAKHGEEQPATVRLFIMGKPCFCVQSKFPPDKTTLKVLQYEKDERAKALTKTPTVAEPETNSAIIKMDATTLRCGYHAFFDGRFAFVSEWEVNVDCTVKFANWDLILTFRHPQLGKQFKVRISYRSIIHLLWSDKGHVSVILSHCPTFIKSNHPDLSWISPTPPSRVPAIDDAHKVVAPFCLVYHFTLPHDTVGAQILRVKHKGIVAVTKHDTALLDPYSTPSGLHFDQAHKRLKKELGQYAINNTLPFDLLFMLQALVHNNYLHPDTVSTLALKLAELFKRAKLNHDNQAPISIDTFKKLFQWIDYPHPDVDSRNTHVGGIIEYLIKEEETYRDRPSIETKLFDPTGSRVFVFRVNVAPTSITFHGPEMEAKNRVLRKFPDHTNHFIRMQFSDENSEGLYYSPRFGLDEIYERFKSVLNTGISIAGRQYDFLGFSHSSLRARSAWISAPFIYQKRLCFSHNIVDDLGDFESIKSPARRAARIGQAFSDTPFAVPLKENGIRVDYIQDVENKDTKRVFSDGVGTISQGAADAIHDVVMSSKGFATCFQIRWAGAKGMLTLDTRLPGNLIRIRPSMRKFVSKDDHNLEICDLAWKPIPLVLNRLLIKILEDMGAPGSWFLELQEIEVERLRGVTLTVFNTAGFLHEKGFCQSVQLHKLLRQIDKMGLDYRTDTFLRNTIEALLLAELRLLKHKSRIPVQQGITLFGVMDETGFLEEGEIYIAYEPSNQDPPPTGKVLVSRSPSLHPGDIQSAINVLPPDDNPLRSLHHCIVFSQKGSRDLPSELSGGDLDGDMYHVIWDEEIVGKVETFVPAEYPPVQPLELDRPVERSDMSDFFIEFMKTDRLGIIANRHQILADIKDLGTLDPGCLKLAELHSAAVDFSKSGREVGMKSMPKNPRWKPDFMARAPDIQIYDKGDVELDDYVVHEYDDDDSGDPGPRLRYYKSEKIIGQLFRAVDEHRIWHESIRRTLPRGVVPFWRDFVDKIIRDRISPLGNVNWHRRVGEATQIRRAYNEAVYSIMVQFSDHPYKPLMELEAFVGTVISKTGSLNSRQRDKSIRLKDEYERISTWIIRDMRKDRSEEKSDDNHELDALELCLACVYVGCNMEGGARTNHGRPSRRASSDNLVSFKFVAASALLRELKSVEISGRNPG